MAEEKNNREYSGERSNSPYIKGLARVQREADEEYKEELLERLSHEAIAPSESLRKTQADIEAYLVERYKNLGIEPVILPKHIFFRPPSINELNKTYGGGVIAVTMTDPQALQDSAPYIDDNAQPLAEVLTALKLAHEIYHGASKVSRYTTQSLNKQTLTGSQRLGLTYMNKYGIEGGAIEEGLATDFEKGVLHDVLSKNYPAQVEFLLNVQKLFDEVLKTTGVDIPVEAINIEQSLIRRRGVVNYPNSYNLTQRLTREVPNFTALAEGVRIEGKTLLLARAVDDVYGKGTYRKVALASENTAAMVSQTLHPKES
jgi:hypothetical protein